MLLYNQRKEFVGIDENDLNGLGFQNINELQDESSDFADLFVKKPGFIHNFKNFSWIDFILHSESDESKAVIHAKGKNYSCTLHISPFYFTSDESGYAVIIKNLRPLKGAEDAQAIKDLEASGGIVSSPAPQAVNPSRSANPTQDKMELDISLDDIQMSKPEASAPEVQTPSASEPELPSFETSHSQELSEPEPLDIPESLEMDSDLLLPTENEFGAPIDIDYGASLDIDDDLSMDEVPDMDNSLIMDDSALDELLLKENVIEVEEAKPEIEETPVKEAKPMLGDYVSTGLAGEEHLSDLIRSGDYQYDPQIAADELGLPVDLIEEFIGDFIDQAHEFHDDLYASVNANDFDNVQILSHKLKGVAANLRVEDAFDVLSVVNVSKDTEEILPNLNHFYKIIAKLEGKEIVEEVAPAPVETVEEPKTAIVDVEEEEYDIGIKQPEDGPLLIDKEVNSDDMYDELLATDKPIPDDDDIYGDDLLGSPDTSFEPNAEVSNTSTDLDDDLYADLLGVPDELDEPETEVPAVIDDDLYDDLLGAPENDTKVAKTSPAIEVTLNFDSQRTANELGIPLDIVKDFVQDFKEQITTHQNDFDTAISSKDIRGVNKTATLLKGMSDNLRLNEISEVLKGLQAEKDIDNTTEALATLQAYADQL